MMLFKLALRNISRARVYYLFYFLILVVFTVLLYSTLAVQTSIQSAFVGFELETAGLNIIDIFYGMTIFIMVLSIGFSMYMSRFFIKRRGDELALYKLIGLNNSKILKLIGIENAIVFTLASSFGIMCGAVFSRIFQQFATDMMAIDIADAGIIINVQAVIISIVTMIIIWIVSLVVPAVYVKTISIAKLFSKRAESSQVKKTPVISIILFMIVVLLLYILVGPGFSYVTARIDLGFYIITVFILAIVCAFTLYKGFLFLLFRILRKFSLQLRRPTFLLSFKHIETETSQLYKLLAVVSIIVGSMTPFGLLVSSVQTAESSSLPSASLNQFSYVTNDATMDQYFLSAFSSERNFDLYSLNYQKVVTQDGIFYMLDIENALKLTYIANPSNDLNYDGMNEVDFDLLDDRIRNLSDNELIFLESFNTVTQLPNHDISLLSQFEQEAAFIRVNIMPTTLHQNSDEGFLELVELNRIENERFIAENQSYVDSFSGLTYLGFHDFTPLNVDASTQHQLVVANDVVFSNIMTTYSTEELTMRLVITPNSVLSNALIQDLNAAQEYYLNQVQPYATTIIDSAFTLSLASDVSTGALFTLAILIYSLLFFVLIATTLFRSLESGEKANPEYKIATHLGVKKISVFTGIALEAFMIMIFPFIVGFIISTNLFLTMFANFIKARGRDHTEMELYDIINIGLPILIAVLIVFLIVVRHNYKNVYKTR